MNPFSFHNPTRVDFGPGACDKAGAVCRNLGTRALLVAGQGSARRSGLLERVERSLAQAGVEIVLHEGVRPNPVLSHVQEGIRKAREGRVDLILAVGGGSVIDSAKAIAAGALASHDVWDFFSGKAKVQAALPLVAVLTLAATGSEMNSGAVVTKEETKEKTFFASPHTFPRVSLLDPALTLTLPAEQTAYGLSDACAHLLEPYCNTLLLRPLVQLELKEALLRCLVDGGARLKRDPQDLEARGDFMWTATLALNGVTSAGIGPAIFPVHMIEHSVSAVTDVAHGAGLSALFPGWLRWRLEQSENAGHHYRLARLGERVFGLSTGGTERARALAAVDALQAWYREIGSPATLAEAGVERGHFEEIAANAARQARAWQMTDYSEAAVREILEAACSA
jgi:alcohol dehydrogenase YqhD (iron-dependent ADH family)